MSLGAPEIIIIVIIILGIYLLFPIWGYVEGKSVQLGQLLDSGAISEEEYQIQKAKILS